MRREDKIRERDKTPLVAIDVGSSGVRAMAATPNADGTLHILGVEAIGKYGCVEKGTVVNSTEAGGLIHKVLLLLKNRIGQALPIDSAFVTIGGQLLQVAVVPVKRNQITRSYIAASLLKEMRTEAVTKIEEKYPQMKVVSAEPIRFVLDDVEQDEEPDNMQKAKQIQVIYNVFVAKAETVTKLEGAFFRAGTSIDFQWAQPEAQMTALLGDADREQGCAVIDFGAQTTTLSIFRHERCVFTKVVPLGGYHITRDIQSQQLRFDTAEKAKVMFGAAAEKYLTESRKLRMTSNNPEVGQVTVSTQLLATIIRSRLGEIVAPIVAELKKQTEQVAKVYLTGGGCMLSGLVPFMQELTSLPVDYGSHADWLELSATEEFYRPEYATLVGTLALAADYRQKVPVGRLTDSPIKKSFWANVKEKTLVMFTDDTIE